MEPNREPRNKPTQRFIHRLIDRGQSTSDKETRTYNRAKKAHCINGAGKIGQIHAKKKKKKTRPPSYTCTRIKSKWIKDLNVNLRP